MAKTEAERNILMIQQLHEQSHQLAEALLKLAKIKELCREDTFETVTGLQSAITDVIDRDPV